MIEVILDLNDEQKKEFRARLFSLNNVCICDKCNALVQFEEKDINRTKILPHIECPCGNSVQLHSKYYKK